MKLWKKKLIKKISWNQHIKKMKVSWTKKKKKSYGIVGCHMSFKKKNNNHD